MPGTPNMTYTWLLFDADGTLFDYDQAEATVLEQAFAEVGTTFEPAHLNAYREINTRGLTQEALAKKAGVHRVYVAQIEGQTKVPSVATLEKLAKALRVKVGRLLE
jgi:DNA-binding XRE family transcriptional regulator